MVKWLGSESCKQALSIRAANAASPDQVVIRIWSRLGDRFESPEIVEGALRKKLNNFQSLSNKDNKTSFELVDIVSENEAIKENPTNKTLLSVYNSSGSESDYVKTTLLHSRKMDNRNNSLQNRT